MPTKDQLRASYAYEKVGALWRAYSDADVSDRKKAKRNCEDYETAVKALGANILRSGLSAALADLMRRKDGAKELRKHLADSQISQIPGLENVTERDLFSRVNALYVGTYMLATRETLQVVMWLKRACDALFDTTPDSAATAAKANGVGHAP